MLEICISIRFGNKVHLISGHAALSCICMGKIELMSSLGRKNFYFFNIRNRYRYRQVRLVKKNTHSLSLSRLQGNEEVRFLTALTLATKPELPSSSFCRFSHRRRSIVTARHSFSAAPWLSTAPHGDEETKAGLSPTVGVPRCRSCR